LNSARVAKAVPDGNGCHLNINQDQEHHKLNNNHVKEQAQAQIWERAPPLISPRAVD
jgi:hypothetical protein